jgi:IS30 family transposase
MDEKIRTLIEQTPEKPPRSKLEPHEDLIRELRRKRCTYQEIAQFFAEHLNLKVAPSTIYAFVRVRARRARRHQAADTNIRRRIEELQGQSLSEEPKQLFRYDENEALRLVHKTTEGANVDASDVAGESMEQKESSIRRTARRR